MLLLEKTIFRGKNKEIEKLIELFINVDKKSIRRKEEINKLTQTLLNERAEKKKIQRELDETNKISSDSISKLMIENNKLVEKNNKIERLRRKSVAAVGGLTAHNNKLIAENTELAFKYTELKKEFEEFKKNKFIVKEIKAEKVPKKTQIMGLRNGRKTSEIISKIKPIEKEEV